MAFIIQKVDRLNPVVGCCLFVQVFIVCLHPCIEVQVPTKMKTMYSISASRCTRRQSFGKYLFLYLACYFFAASDHGGPSNQARKSRENLLPYYVWGAGCHKEFANSSRQLCKSFVWVPGTEGSMKAPRRMREGSRRVQEESPSRWPRKGFTVTGAKTR